VVSRLWFLVCGFSFSVSGFLQLVLRLSANQ
jgi:hypothetical protein